MAEPRMSKEEAEHVMATLGRKESENITRDEIAILTEAMAVLGIIEYVGDHPTTGEPMYRMPKEGE